MSSDLKKYKLDEFAKLVKKQYQPNADEELIYIGLEHIEQQTLRINGYGNSKNVISQKYTKLYLETKPIKCYVICGISALMQIVQRVDF